MSGKMYHRIKKDNKWTWIACTQYEYSMLNNYYGIKKCKWCELLKEKN